ncbi:MAG TPA: class I SAM-dependent methyltransferase [Acidimicrobiales bacterium]|nr:class I SAM-dependent methyltransferase [Acidimicrobiales bacterium]
MTPTTIAEAYSQTGAVWQAGPGAIYDRLATVLVDCRPTDLRGRVVLDLGAGTGAASRAIAAVGGIAVAADAAYGMLAADRTRRPAAVVGDACALPLRDRAVDAVVAAFSLNHLDDPVAGLREAARVTCPGGALLASAYAEDDRHPVKDAAEVAAREHGWQPPPWYPHLRANAIPKLASVERAVDALHDAGLQGEARAVRIAFPELGPDQLLAWRFGMAQLAPFVATLGADARAAMVHRAKTLLDDAPLVRSIIVLVATA